MANEVNGENETETPSPWAKLVKLESTTNTFTSPTSGRTYYVNRRIDELSLKRYEMLEKMLTEMQFSMTHDEFMEHLAEQAKCLNTQNWVMAGVINYNLMTGLTDFQSKYIITWWISTIYIARDDEDVTEWSETLAKEKIEDWRKNYDASFFLQLRDTMFSKLIKLCERISQDFSNYPLNPTFTQERMRRLKTKYPLSQDKEP